MTTKPHHDYESIAHDAIQLHAVARGDVGDKAFSKHIDAHELDAFAANAAKLKMGSAARTSTLDEQVAAGAHVTQVCAKLAGVCRAVRDAAELEFFADASKRNEPMARAFGMGHALDAGSLPSVELFAHTLLAAAAAHPQEAAKVHLDAKGLHHLHDLITAAEGADVAHTVTRANRHDAATTLDSLAHLVSAESAHIRFVARRVYRDDEAKLAHYASTLPRHAVQHRTRLAPPAAAPATTPA